MDDTLYIYIYIYMNVCVCACVCVCVCVCEATHKIYFFNLIHLLSEMIGEEDVF